MKRSPESEPQLDVTSRPSDWPPSKTKKRKEKTQQELTSVGEDGSIGPLHGAGAAAEDSMAAPQKGSKCRLTTWASNSASGRVPKEWKARIQTDIGAPVFTASSRRPKVKTAQCLSADRWLNMIWFFHATTVTRPQEGRKSGCVLPRQ